jgi:hypothetical protein
MNWRKCVVSFTKKFHVPGTNYVINKLNVVVLLNFKNKAKA